MGRGPLSTSGASMDGGLSAAGPSVDGRLLSTAESLMVTGGSPLIVGMVHFHSIKQSNRISTCLFIMLNRGDVILSLSFASLSKA